MDFITIDFETATSERDSPCEIGLTFVRDFQIVDTKSWLIKPLYDSFNDFNISIHGITPNDVVNAPEFDELWKELLPLIDNQFLIAHNASFDFSVLRRTLETYQIPYPNLQYSCSYIFSKKIWVGQPAYDLKSLCRLNDIKFNHHRAGDDSLATAKLAIKAFQHAGVASIEDFSDKFKIRIGQLFEGGYKPSTANQGLRTNKKIQIIREPYQPNPDSIFFGKTVVFTGALSMVRAEAQQIISEIGGIVSNTVTKDTNFLVVGQQDYKIVGDDGMSSKQEKAVKLIAKGSALEIISEDTFLRNI